jgi:LCP family protein required for cell wall assembly
VQVRPRRHMALVSLPRDTRISVPGHGDHKLNAAYALGGPALTRQTVEQAAGVTVDHTVVVNSTGLAALVDALGGARVTVPQRMDYDDTAQDLHIHLQPGERLLDGRQAVGFVRYRSDGKGDLGRLQRQQTFLKALTRQAATLGSLRRIGAIGAAFHRSLQTDLTPRQILALAYTMPGLSGADISASTLPGTPRYLHGVSYYIADLSTLPYLLSPESDPQNPPASSDTDVTLAVLNGCGRNGYARRADSSRPPDSTSPRWRTRPPAPIPRPSSSAPTAPTAAAPPRGSRPPSGTARSSSPPTAPPTVRSRSSSVRTSTPHPDSDSPNRRNTDDGG